MVNAAAKGQAGRIGVSEGYGRVQVGKPHFRLDPADNLASIPKSNALDHIHPDPQLDRKHVLPILQQHE